MNALSLGIPPLLLGGNLSEERFSSQTLFPTIFTLKIPPVMAPLLFKKLVFFPPPYQGEFFNLEVLGRGLGG